MLGVIPKKSVCLRRYLVCVYKTVAIRCEAPSVLQKGQGKFICTCPFLKHKDTAGVDAVLCKPMYRYVRQPSGSVSCMEYTCKIRFPKSSGRNFVKTKETATENTINPLISVAFYFLKGFISPI